MFVEAWVRSMRENLHWFTDSAGAEGNSSDEKFRRPHCRDVVRCLVSGQSRIHHTVPCRRCGTRLDSHHKPRHCLTISLLRNRHRMGTWGTGTRLDSHHKPCLCLTISLLRNRHRTGTLGTGTRLDSHHKPCLCLTISLLKNRHRMGTWGTGAWVCLSVRGPEQ